MEDQTTRTSSLEVVNTTEGIAQAISQFSLEFREYQKAQDQRWADLYTCLDKIESIAIEARDAALDHAQAPPSPETIKGKAKEEQQPPPTRSSIPTPPEILKSTKARDVKQWMMKVAVWASFSNNRFTSEWDMVKYLLTLMEGEAGDWALPHLAKLMSGDPRAEIYDMNTFGREFALAFDDPDAERAVARKITELVQTSTTTEYTTLFRTYAAELNWNDAALRAQFSRGLHFKVKEVLSQREVQPANLRDLINAANKIDQTRCENEESCPNQDKKEKDKGKGKSNSSNSKSDKKEDSKYGDNYVSKEERDRRQEAGECIKCGNKGHAMKECRTGWKPPKTKEETKDTKVKKESAKVAKVDEEEEKNAESEKD
ncbi:hypothetical protein RSAG8_03562, partial [Rhizoctonia solani AG-8 WAC10335]